MESGTAKDSGPQNGARFAAIDLGTNSCRLLIATPNPRAIKVVYAFSRMVRLGEDLERTGQISPEAMERTVASLKLCASKMREYNVTRYCAVATAACRMARNSQELIDRIKAEAGLDVRIIDDGQEAELSLLGCAALLQPTIPYAIVFDIGGGSTEVMWVDNRYPGKPKIIDYVSVPLGVISDTLAEGQSAQALKTMGRMLQTLSQAHDIPRHMAEGQVQMIGTSGTVTTLAAIDMGLTKYDRGTIDGISVDATKLIQVVERLYGMTERERSNHPCIGPTRVDLILPGAAIFRCIHDCWPIKELSIADRGVREGILMEMFDQSSSIGERLVVYQRG
jgi:exopolyphosphatase/guanosine-5'-triphosphate,3'-diphosphate pyrophosphatase